MHQVDGKYQVFIPVAHGYHMETSESKAKHELVGFMIWNKPGIEPNEKTHVVPVVAWGEPEDMFIFPDKPMTDDFPL